jgi:hypothetical protein
MAHRARAAPSARHGQSRACRQVAPVAGVERGGRSAAAGGASAGAC